MSHPSRGSGSPRWRRSAAARHGGSGRGVGDPQLVTESSFAGTDPTPSATATCLNETRVVGGGGRVYDA
jgi:hypothetical protein